MVNEAHQGTNSFPFSPFHFLFPFLHLFTFSHSSHLSFILFLSCLHSCPQCHGLHFTIEILHYLYSQVIIMFIVNFFRYIYIFITAVKTYVANGAFQDTQHFHPPSSPCPPSTMPLFGCCGLRLFSSRLEHSLLLSLEISPMDQLTTIYSAYTSTPEEVSRAHKMRQVQNLYMYTMYFQYCNKHVNGQAKLHDVFMLIYDYVLGTLINPYQFTILICYDLYDQLI
ncbi:hypothetical protein AB205_0123390 [Aquarana catesbeiana]|uniref:Uncharacterized protein n=1 Tax=Aquarana catesbeiana TaxID=8400 RepID=A0A2G9NCC1_AQUCT|nr:hypothetical protein AB205_0123390 [Aquarana catesbeiana]